MFLGGWLSIAKIILCLHLYLCQYTTWIHLPQPSRLFITITCINYLQVIVQSRGILIIHWLKLNIYFLLIMCKELSLLMMLVILQELSLSLCLLFPQVFMLVLNEKASIFHPPPQQYIFFKFLVYGCVMYFRCDVLLSEKKNQNSQCSARETRNLCTLLIFKV